MTRRFCLGESESFYYLAMNVRQSGVNNCALRRAYWLIRTWIALARSGVVKVSLFLIVLMSLMGGGFRSLTRSFNPCAPAFPFRAELLVRSSALIGHFSLPDALRSYLPVEGMAGRR